MNSPSPIPALSPIKIFQLNDCDWFAAESLDGAKRAYAEMCGYNSAADAEAKDLFDEPHEVCSDGLDRLKFTDEETTPPTVHTFREQLALMVSQGCAFPCFFASTEG